MPARPSECFDYVVVGAGAAGCVLAARLSEDPKIRVLLVEAGTDRDSLTSRIPALTLFASAHPGRNWAFETAPIPALGGRRQIWNQGRMVGGSSAINGMIYMRGQPHEYDDWAQAGGTGWSFSALLPYFRRSEASRREAGPWHGDTGAVTTRPCALDLPVCTLFLESMKAAGYPIVEDLNGDFDQGFGRYDCNIDKGRRISAARAYLATALRRPNLTLRTGMLAKRIAIVDGRAEALELERDGLDVTVRPRCEIVLAAGAINSPALLLASGIGPAADLRAAGVAVAADRPAVGRGLRNHPVHFDAYGCQESIDASRLLRPDRALRALAAYLVARRGPLAESFLAVGGFLRSDPSLTRPDTIALLVPSLVRRVSGRGGWRQLLPGAPGFTIATSLGRPRSTGTVRLASPDPTRPLISPDYFDDPADLDALARAVRIMRRAVAAGPLGALVDPAAGPVLDSDDLDAIRDSILRTAGSLSHPTGTCRMGRDADAVVGPSLKVNGVAGLRVADASIIPRAFNACTHAAALMIGEKASDLIRGRAAATNETGRRAA